MKTALGLLAVAAVCVAGCAAIAPSIGPTSSPLTQGPATSLATSSAGAPTPVASTAPATVPPATQAQTATPEAVDSGGSTTGGDIPDNAVFLTYSDAPHGFTIQYVEGWQVTPGTDGVVIRDKDSSETVQIVQSVSDVASYISSTDLPQLQSLSGFTLDKQDMVGVNGMQLNHLVYHAPSPPDPVTGKEVPSTIDRYYVPRPNGQLAVISLSTPDGVDNVDAFRQMIKSFVWV